MRKLISVSRSKLQTAWLCECDCSSNAVDPGSLRFAENEGRANLKRNKNTAP